MTEADSLGEEQVGKSGEEEDQEKKPATERKRDYTDLELGLRERDEHVACYASVFGLAMENDACREAEM